MSALPRTSAMTFPVDAVTPATAPLRITPMSSAIHRTGARLLAMSDPDRPIILPESGHSLIQAVRLAYGEHRPLVLSPDAIWLAIAQGFGHHVNANAELLRYRFVSHAGKQELKVASSPRIWKDVISSFSSQIREHTDPVIHETLLCDFSTTTPDIRTASEVVLMDSYSNYFAYSSFSCGIPQITIQGDRDDWERIRQRVEVLETFDLGWWVPRLRPILDEFIAVTRGDIATEFWQSIYTSEPTYGNACFKSFPKPTGERITGWIGDLLPYVGDDPHRRRNPMLTDRRNGWTQPGRGVAPDAFPSGITKVDVGGHGKHELRAGFFGVSQDPSNLALAPAIGWAVTEKREPPPPRVPDPEMAALVARMNARIKRN